MARNTSFINNHKQLCYYFIVANVVILLCVLALQFNGLRQPDFSPSAFPNNFSLHDNLLPKQFVEESHTPCYDGTGEWKADQVTGYLQPLATGIEGISFLGGLNPAYNYSVYSLTTENSDIVRALNYAFYAPLTALAWQRIGYRSLVVVTVSQDERNWRHNVFLVEVVKRVLEMDAFVLFVQCGMDQLVTVSQVSRTMAPSIASRLCPAMLDVVMVTSDVDLWPLSPALYTLPHGKKIRCLDASCCGNFQHKNNSYRMLPMSNIGMLSSTWNEVMSEAAHGPPITPSDLLQMLVDEFGPQALLPVIKGSNEGWYRDQHLISIHVQRWIDRSGNESVDFVQRHVYIDRLDRHNWTTHFQSLNQFNDTHLLLYAFRAEQWNTQLLPIIKMMYANEFSKLLWCQDYFNIIHDMIVKANLTA